MNNYVIEYEIENVLTGNRSARRRTFNPIPAESKYNAVALLAQRIGENDSIIVDIYSVEEIN